MIDRDKLNQTPGERVICEWCGCLIIRKNKRFCSRLCQNRYFALNKTKTQILKQSKSISGDNNPQRKYGVSESTRQKISENAKLRTGEKNSFYGKHHSEETKQKLREINTGRKMSEESRRKSSESHKGFRHSEESKKRLSEAHKRIRENYVYDPNKNQPSYRKTAIETYGYECELCGCIEGKLAVHHLDGNHNNDDIENLVVLCESCHGKIHPNKLRGDSTPDEKLTNMILESRALNN